MSAVPSERPLAGAAVGGQEAAPLSLPAKIYFGAVVAAAAAVAGPLLAGIDRHTHGWPTFFVLAIGAAVAQLFVVRTVRDYSLHTSVVFLIAAAVLLPPELVVLMGVVQHIPEWLKVRYVWYIQTFNICNYTLNGLAAWWVVRAVTRSSGIVDGNVRWAVAGLAACVVFVGMNHLLLSVMLYLGRGHRVRETGLFAWANLSTELVLAALGIGLASLWRANPWLVPFGVTPLLLIHRSLHVPRLEQQARIDPKTGLFNARHFATALDEELARAGRFGRPASLIMADLDLLREINNSYGHLAGDVVLAGVADVFREQLRPYDVPARFGGEEFAILLPETPEEQAFEIAERVRKAVAARLFEVETSSEPLRVTISMGVATFPKDCADANELVHHADLAVYRAKLQGRNRVLAASEEPLLLRGSKAPRIASLRERAEAGSLQPAAAAAELSEVPVAPPAADHRRTPGHAVHGPRFMSLSTRLVALVTLVASFGLAIGVAGIFLGTSRNFVGMLVAVAAVGIAQALAFEAEYVSVSVGAIGVLTGMALFGPRAALLLAATIAIVDWSARRPPVHQVLFNFGTLTIAATAAAGVFALDLPRFGEWLTIVMGLAAGGAYYLTNVGLLSLALALEGRENWLRIWQERFYWLAPHYLGYGFVAGVMAIAYDAVGLYSVAVALVPLLLMRKTQATYLTHAQRSAHKLREAGETIQAQNASLEKANRLLRERSTAAMESLSATVDARDSYTAGHSRRVQRLALAIGRALDMSDAELDLLGHAALFHDIGKLAIPDAVLLKPDRLDAEEWGLMQRHSDEGARIIDRLGFLEDAVPAIRHHHERYDGTGYPDHLQGEEIPLGARIIHVADALDSMLTTRIYRNALTPAEALVEFETLAGRQFCPRCVGALKRILPPELLGSEAPLELLIA